MFIKFKSKSYLLSENLTSNLAGTFLSGAYPSPMAVMLLPSLQEKKEMDILSIFVRTH